jgi:choline transporter-like protein 2/4/5
VSGTGTYLCVVAALEGKKFSVSASKAKLRKLRLVNEVASVANFLISICRLLVSTSVGILIFFIFTDRIGHLPPTHYKVVAAATTLFAAHFISRLFFSVYAVAIDTIAICFGKLNVGG